ncbi:MAG: phosphate ABC transporter substrate-binding protein [Actinobacteria bacterium HGW-Actinobacteria-7]|nr:MAG: phosphate ABC transporter substrate-binding protein [Actinobacteria bacterium HGW-Actinobacteria-7]
MCVGLLSGCSSGHDSTTQLIVTGSTTILPIAEQAAEGYQKANPGTSVLVSGQGSSAGIEAVMTGTSEIGSSSRDLKPEEEGKGLVDTPIAFDGIAVIVNPSNPISGLTVEQLRAIFSGEVSNWKQLGGEDRDIDLVNRDEASGTREAFKKIVMTDDAKFDRSAVVLPGTGQVRDVVARAPGAIGYISVGFVAPRFGSLPVKALPVDGVEPTKATVTSKKYPIARTLHFFTKGEPTGLTAKFIEYVLSDKVQQGVVVDAGFVPVSDRDGR